jgi:RNA polymerase sigma factor (sigma-70 family)
LQSRHDWAVRAADFHRIYAEHAQSLLSFLAYRTGDRALAEDLLAETFERALRARWRFDRRRASEKTWIYSIALNCMRDHARRRSAEERALSRVGASEPAAGPDPLENVEARDSVHNALGVLSDEEREAVALRYGADLTVPEIAKLTKQPLTTVEGRVYRGLRKLRDALQPS